MKKQFLKTMIIYLCMSPLYIQAGWGMELQDELKNELESAARKVGRMIEYKRHVFEETNNHTCKGCKKPKANCHGFGGEISENITTKAKELNILLNEMESILSESDAIVYDVLEKTKKQVVWEVSKQQKK
jgi:hypothetical protein